MKNDKLKGYITNIIESDEFFNGLEKINLNYFNLKQESHIRNLLLELFNYKYFHVLRPSYRAVAEYPRGDHKRVDLSILDLASKSNDKHTYSVELKYQFPKDKELKNDIEIIQSDYINREVDGKKTDMFILVVASWKVQAKKEYDAKFIMGEGLNAHMNEKDEWKTTLKSVLDFRKESEVFEHDWQLTNKPYNITNNFTILTRKK